MFETIPKTHYINQWGQIVPLNSPPPLPYPKIASELQPSPQPAPAATDLAAAPEALLLTPSATAEASVAEKTGVAELQPSAEEEETPDPPKPRRHRHSQRRRAKRSSAPRETSREHHQRHCAICCRDDRELIEEEFLHWHNPDNIAFDYKIGARSVYRHAHAMGLFARRDANLRFALAGIIQRAHNFKGTADSVIRAVRAYTRVTAAGEWIDPPARVIVSSGGRFVEPQSVAQALDSAKTIDLPPAPAAPALASNLPDNENKVENGATP